MPLTSQVDDLGALEGLTRSIGANLRRHRDFRGLSSSELARESGIARTTIHKLEHGQANPTLDTLYTLARSLGVSLTDLVAPSEEAHLNLVKASDAVTISTSAGLVRLLTRIDVIQSTMEVMTLSLQKGERIYGSVHQVGVVEHVIVQYGAIRGGLDTNPVALEEGDYLRFAGENPHSYVGVSDEASVVLLMETARHVSSSQLERKT